MSPRDSVLNLIVAFPVLYDGKDARGLTPFWFMERHIHGTVEVTGFDNVRGLPKRGHPIFHMDGEEGALNYICERYTQMLADGWHLKRSELA